MIIYTMQTTSIILSVCFGVQCMHACYYYVMCYGFSILLQVKSVSGCMSLKYRSEIAMSLERVHNY